MILGGHSHTVLEQPAVVNDILIAQAGVGTDQIGRFDIVVDDDTNSIVEWKWQLVPITTKTAQADLELETFINQYRDKVNHKYNGIITRFSRKLTHPKREVETTLGNLIADAMIDHANTDVLLLGSGGIRGTALGPVVTLGDLKACYPYDDSLTRFTITGKQLKAIFNHIMRSENRNGEGECFQVNHGVKAVYSETEAQLLSLSIDNKPVDLDQTYTITLQNYHIANSLANLNISNEDLNAIKSGKIVSTSGYQVIEEWLRDHPNEKREIEGRLVYV